MQYAIRSLDGGLRHTRTKEAAYRTTRMTNWAGASIERHAPKPRKGQLYRRKSDGFIFVVVSASRAVEGAFLHSIDATQVFEWDENEKIAAYFDKIPKTEARVLAKAAFVRWRGNDRDYSRMRDLAKAALRANQ